MATWGYGKCCGPETWPKSFPAAGGEHQSPVNIVVDQAEYDAQLEKSKMSIEIMKGSEQTLLFTGHNFKIEADNHSSVINGGPAASIGTFKFAQLHFHWGKSEKDHGSEHQINGRSFPSELHLVHYNVNKYPSCGEAATHGDGLMVLGILIEIGKKNDELEKLMVPLSSIRSAKSLKLDEQHSSLDFNGLLPKNIDRYFTYAGSLTTPPCSESVTWVVFEQPITMSSDQLSRFCGIHADDTCGTSENFRPICPLNKRKVKKSFK